MANSLSAVISADVSGFNRALTDAKKVLSQFDKEQGESVKAAMRLNDVTDEQVNAFKKVVANIEKATNGTKSYKQSASSLEKELQKLRQQWSNLSDTAKSSSFGKTMSEQIRQAQNRIEQLRASASKTEVSLKGLGTGAKGLGGNFNIMSSAIGKIGGAVAIAEGAFKVFKDAMRSTEEGIDAWDSKIQSASTTYSRFVAQIGRGDFAKAFSYEGLIESWNLGMSAYNAQDAKSTFINTMGIYKQNVDKQVAELQRLKSEGGKVTKEMIDKVKENGNAYISSLGAMTRESTRKTFEAKWNGGTGNVDFNDEGVQSMLALIRQGEDVHKLMNATKYSSDDIKKVREEENKRREEFYAEILKEKEEIGKMYDRGELSSKEFQKRIQDVTARQNDFDNIEKKSTKMEEFNKNVDIAKILALNEEALVEYINAWKEFYSEETTWEQKQRLLNRLLEKQNGADKLKVGTIAYYRDQQKTIKEKKENEVTNSDAWKKLDEAEKEIQKKIDEIEKRIADGSIADLQRQIDIETKIQTEVAVDSETYRQSVKRVEELKKQQASIRGEIEGTIKDLENRIANLNYAISVALDDDSRIKLRQELGELQDELDRRKGKYKIELEVYKPTTTSNTKTPEIKTDYLGDLSTINSEMNNLYETTKNLAEMDNPFEFFGALIRSVQGVQAMTKAMQELGIISQASALQQVTASSEVATANGVEAASAATAATANVFKAHSAIPFVGIAIAGAMIAGMVAMIANARNSIPKYAEGGIIGGATSLGDFNIARVNSGEAILNGSQQKRLFSILNGGGGLNSDVGSPEIKMVIKGSDLHTIISNYNKKTGRVR